MIWFVAGVVVTLAGVYLFSLFSQRRPVRRRRARPLTAGPDTAGPLSRDSRIDPLAQAVAALPSGLVVANNAGEIVYEHASHLAESAGRHVLALVDGEARTVLEQARRGPVKRQLDLFGPPRMFLELEGAPILNEGRVVVGTTVVITDVTERHNVEAVRRDFVANVSHELKTPIGAICVLAETLMESDDPEVVARLSTKLQSESVRLGRTVDDLLVLSRIEGGTSAAFVETPLDEVLRQAVDETFSVAEANEIDISGPPTTQLAVFGDHRQLVSGFSNLLENAVRYSDAGSTVKIDVEKRGQWITIFVADQGIGIPEAELDRIFERFYRVDPARSRNTGGTGLGLSIVRHVILNHGGDLSVTSTEGEGSIFRVDLPFSDDLQPSSDITPGPKKMAHG